MEGSRSSVDELLETNEGRCEFAKEELAFEATETIAELMELANVSKRELAKRTGTSKAYITQVLSGSRNMTVHTLANLAFALGYKIRFKTTQIDEPIVLATKVIVAAQPTIWKDEKEVVLERAETPAPVFLSARKHHRLIRLQALQTAA